MHILQGFKLVDDQKNLKRRSHTHAIKFFRERKKITIAGFIDKKKEES
jgi:hypothetical protein